MRIRIIFAGLLLAWSSVSASAQTSSELARKYGALKSPYQGAALAYEVRPGFFLTVKYADDGQACEMRIEAFPKYEPITGQNVVMSEELMTTLIDELVPESGRGDKDGLYGFTFWFGQAGTRSYSYDNVSISVGNGWGLEEGKRQEKMFGTVQIEWKNRHCRQQ
jgi:hypothetical protein